MGPPQASKLLNRCCGAGLSGRCPQQAGLRGQREGLEPVALSEQREDGLVVPVLLKGGVLPRAVERVEQDRVQLVQDYGRRARDDPHETLQPDEPHGRVRRVHQAERRGNGVLRRIDGRSAVAEAGDDDRQRRGEQRTHRPPDWGTPGVAHLSTSSLAKRIRKV